MIRQRTTTLGCAVVTLCIVSTLALAAGLPTVLALHFSDMSPQLPLPAQPLSWAPETVAPEVPASAWLWQRGWERVWPLLVEGRTLQLAFAGPPAQRYLRLAAD